LIGYVTIGINDLARAGAFYEPIMAELGVPLARTSHKSMSWGKFGGGRGLSITKPFDGHEATVGNGSMVALEARDQAHVDRVHTLALSLGAVCEGPPGIRGATYYGAYFRDPDGNKLCVYVMPDASPGNA
jgi:catechol 2,3-dioxygenase-like lactoylglutathione lyase family enzyme